MRLQEAANQLGISERSLYRLIKEGLLLYHLEPVPILTANTYHIDADYLAEVKRRLPANRKHKRVAAVRAILQELKED